MKFDIYFPFFNRAGVACPGLTPHHWEWKDIMAVCARDKQKTLLEKIRSCDDKTEKAELKKLLPAITPMGVCADGKKRAAENTTPTDWIMLDIDHCSDAKGAYLQFFTERGEEWMRENCLFAHITPSLGLRIVIAPNKNSAPNIEAQLKFYNNEFQLSRFGDFDTGCKDFSRLSFLPAASDFLYINEILYKESEEPQETFMKNVITPVANTSEPTAFVPLTEDEKRQFSELEYRGTPMQKIIDKWVEVNGKPESGEIHNYYNELVKNFRHIVSNNKRALLYILPRFGHSEAECWSQIASICKVNTASILPKPFYFFLKDNGFYGTTSSLAEFMMNDEQIEDNKMPWLPPVFREFVKCTPKDFRPSLVNALLPVMGTLASYLQARYYYDDEMHTPSFFSIIYAPPGTGKGFAKRILDRLFEYMRLRDKVQEAREQIYLQKMNRKSQDEKAPEDPHTTPRIIPCKNSETELLETMRDCHGYHLFTYAAEMDSWAKGVRSAGGNKDDMIRIAWDNGLYGQAYKNAATFKGEVALYWNVLITGTIEQVMAYYKNVTNGLVTRCSFTTIDNQEFASPAIWRAMGPKDIDVLRKFMMRCDHNTYVEGVELLPSEDDLACIHSEDFDKEVKWKFHFKPKQTVNMEWLREAIDEFNEKHRVKAAVDFDKARDVFRRRVAVRGFRLGILCYALWDKPRQSDLKKCIPFIEWWMETDLENSLKLWGSRYNEAVNIEPALPQKSLFAALPSKFTKTELFSQCVRMGIKSTIRCIVSNWKKLGYVKKIGSNEWEKIKENDN